MNTFTVACKYYKYIHMNPSLYRYPYNLSLMPIKFITSVTITLLLIKSSSGWRKPLSRPHNGDLWTPPGKVDCFDKSACVGEGSDGYGQSCQLVLLVIPDYIMGGITVLCVSWAVASLNQLCSNIYEHLLANGNILCKKCI